MVAPFLEPLAQARPGLVFRGHLVTTRMLTSTGRAVAVSADLLVNGRMRLSDDGDSWSDLVSGGYADPVPSSADREKIVRLCEMHRVQWDSKRRAIYSITETASVEDVEAGVLRVTAAAVALTGWRAWYPPTHHAPDTMALARRIENAATTSGWLAELDPVVEGRLHKWPTKVRLHRRSRGAAAVLFTHDHAEAALQQAIGFVYDVRDHGLVLVVSKGAKSIQESLRSVDSLKDRVATVDRASQRLPEDVVRATEKVAA